LVADIHFQAKVALLVADAFEKIRINPGNFSDGRKTFEETTYDDPEEFARERDYMQTVSLRLITPLQSMMGRCVHDSS
jgi:(E)-4-hydroxy-3-methylbut-2-enyl-diphosphate synthase